MLEFKVFKDPIAADWHLKAELELSNGRRGAGRICKFFGPDLGGEARREIMAPYITKSRILESKAQKRELIYRIPVLGKLYLYGLLYGGHVKDAPKAQKIIENYDLPQSFNCTRLGN